MMKKVLLTSIILLFSLLTVTSGHVHAAFTANRLIDDTVFDYSGSMSAAQIDSFLNTFPNSCISTNSGFDARIPAGYSPSTGFSFGDFGSAGTIISRAAQVYGINPQVLLVTLQKEQSLVAGGSNGFCTNNGENMYAAAAGYGCPDGGTVYNWSGVSLYRRNGIEHTTTGSTCVNTAAKAGFSQQVIRAAWLLKFGEQRSKGNINWAVITGSWNNSDDPQTCYGGPMTQGTFQVCPSGPTVFYDGYQTIDGQAVHMDTGGTAALYWYTPHFAGNQNFVSIFDSWFGSTQTLAPFAWANEGSALYSDAARTHPFTAVATIVPGGKIYGRIRARNLGNQTWDPSFMHVGTDGPMDRTSVFQDASWINFARPAALTESSVAPDDVGTFDFVLQAPTKLGTYNEAFNLVAEGRTWLNELGLYWTINVNNPASTTSGSTVLSSGSVLNVGDTLMSPDRQSVLTLLNNGNLALFANFQPVWNTGIMTGAKKLIMQTDGNLVLYTQNMVPLWNSQTNGNPGAHLELQTDGNLVIYSSTQVPLWSTSTVQNPSHDQYINMYMPMGLMYPGQSIDTADRRYHLIMQGDGNLVLYSPTRALWASGTDGKQVAFLALQADGNFVLYARDGHPLWYSNTAGASNLHLTLQQDGNLVLYDANGAPHWSTQTNGQQ